MRGDVNTEALVVAVLAAALTSLVCFGAVATLRRRAVTATRRDASTLCALSLRRPLAARWRAGATQSVADVLPGARVPHVDRWGTPFVFEGTPASVCVRSAGPDVVYESSDDVVACCAPPRDARPLGGLGLVAPTPGPPATTSAQGGRMKRAHDR